MVEGTFDAAHQLIGHKGPCENLHGHSWKVQLFLNGNKLNKLGVVVDFKEIKTALNSILAKFDHTNLNSLSRFKKMNPTSENIAKLVFDEAAKKLVGVSKVNVFESAISSASYKR